MVFQCEYELTRRLFVRERKLLGFMRPNSPTSARHGDGLGYIRIWVTPSRRLVFWDDATSPYSLLPFVLIFLYSLLPVKCVHLSFPFFIFLHINIALFR